MSTEALRRARAQTTSHTSPEFRRMEEDVLIQNGLGSFFAAKLRSGVLFEIYQQTGSPESGKLALAHYRASRETWAKMAERAKNIYRSDVSYGDVPMRRGHWSDRLPAIDADLAAMQDKLQTPPASTGPAENAERAIRAATGKPNRPSVHCVHTPPSSFRPGQAVALSLNVPSSSAHDAPTSVTLHYRHVNQAERWLSLEMRCNNISYKAEIPGDYTDSVYSLQYYFELSKNESAWLYPAFNSTLSNQPYYAISKRSV
jgi:hypothetical protein